MPPDNNRDDEVGYGKPPRRTRFTKGQSGNPRGRLPGAKNLKTLLSEALNEFVIVTENGAGGSVGTFVHVTSSGALASPAFQVSIEGRAVAAFALMPREFEPRVPARRRSTGAGPPISPRPRYPAQQAWTRKYPIRCFSQGWSAIVSVPSKPATGTAFHRSRVSGLAKPGATCRCGHYFETNPVPVFPFFPPK